MRAKVTPTHLLRVEVPLDLGVHSTQFDAVEDAVKLVLAVSRAAYDGEICDSPMVYLDVVDG